MSRYQKAFARIATSGTASGAFIPFTLLGYPDSEQCFESIKIMIEQGATALELGIAFSDPLADGPVIQAAAKSVIESGFSVDDALALIRRVRAFNHDIPIGLLVYMNTVMARGEESFYKAAKESGVDGILIADLPPEEADDLIALSRRYGIDQIFIASPLSPDERLDKIAEIGSGFIYGVSRLGVTGSVEKADAALGDMLSKLRAKTDLPICVGFGISSPSQARRILALGASGVITGSKIIEIVQSSRDFKISLADFLREMTAVSSLADEKPETAALARSSKGQW